MTKFECWQSPEHAMLFDSKACYPSFCLEDVYGGFNEFVLAKQFLPKDLGFKLLDVGCATGEIYRYFKRTFPGVDYTGCDISKAAIERAKTKYPEGVFMLTDPLLASVKDISPDYVFCRDVIVHQEDPLGLLKSLCFMANKGLILRLRTRDKGETVLDSEKSCQLNYGKWAPYMILNCEEMLSSLESFKRCSKVVMIKNYMPLGGYNCRFIPRDCYLEETGTAETAMYIELSACPKGFDVITETRKESYAPSLFSRILYRIIQKSVGGRSRSRIWW